MLPSQSSSEPLQISPLGTAALHALRPLLRQARTPLQLPTAAPPTAPVLKQSVVAETSIASGLQLQLPSVGTQDWCSLPSRPAVVLHLRPGEQSASCLHEAAQNQPPAPALAAGLPVGSTHAAKRSAGFAQTLLSLHATQSVGQRGKQMPNFVTVAAPGMSTARAPQIAPGSQVPSTQNAAQRLPAAVCTQALAPQSA